MSDQAKHNPVVPASQSLPELTIPVLVLGVVLAVVMGAANTYLGLFAGMTVSASIPAAVIAIAALKAFRGNILQNNAVQTAASAGESLAAGIIFTMPALIMMGAWSRFSYMETTLIAVFGGVLGVLFTIPLRRALIVGSDLKFPEGVATAEVLKVDQKGGGGLKFIAVGGLVGALFKFGSSGLALWHEKAAVASRLEGSLWFFGSNLSPALVAVGFIVRLNIAIVVVIGGVLNWYVVIPVVSSIRAGMSSPPPERVGDILSQEVGSPIIASVGERVGFVTTQSTTAVQDSLGLWSAETRFLGVGAMLVGGLWAIIKLRGPLINGVRASIAAYRNQGEGETDRLEQDTPMTWVLVGSALMLIPVCLLFYYFTGRVGISLLMSFFVVFFGFLFSAVAAYMAGLVGSSHNPISGVTICTILLSAVILSLMKMDPTAGPIAAILIGGVVCCAAALGGDNMQDLKAGHLVGSTPWKLQLMQLLGVLAAAVVLAPILNMLHEAYGIGSTKLSAPQGTLMSYVGRGPWDGLPWVMVIIGSVFAVLAIVLDQALEKGKGSFRVPVLALAVGIYLPLELTVPILLGGILYSLVARKVPSDQNGTLLAAGIITGEALVGILLAIPIAITKRTDIMSLGDSGFMQSVFSVLSPQVIGLIMLAGVCLLFYRMSTKPDETAPIIADENDPDDNAGDIDTSVN